MTITPDKVAELRAKATPGPWCVDRSYQWPSKVRAAPPFDKFWICDTSNMPDLDGKSIKALDNAALIAAAPDMADLIAAQAAEIERLRGACSYIVENPWAHVANMVKVCEQALKDQTQ
jgi:hypothetical protein